MQTDAEGFKTDLEGFKTDLEGFGNLQGLAAGNSHVIIKTPC
jgi:hypothetical protein